MVKVSKNIKMTLAKRFKIVYYLVNRFTKPIYPEEGYE